MVAIVVNATATVGGAGQNISLTLNANEVSGFYSSALSGGLNLNFIETVFENTVGTTPLGSVSFSLDVPDTTVTESKVIGPSNAPVIILAEQVAGSGGEVIVASEGGLNYTGSGSTSEEIVVLSGNSDISLTATTGSEIVALNAGDNTIFAGSGATTISAGTGANSIFAGSGGTDLYVEGQDSIQLGGGSSTITVGNLYGGPDVASAVVYGDTSPTVQSSIFFAGEGVNASTVFGGTSGSDTFFAGAGGGYFQAGSGGGSLLYAGPGAVTLVGGQSGGDVLNGLGGTNVVFVTSLTETKGDLILTGAGTSSVFLLGSADTVDAGSGQTTISAVTGGFVNAGSGSLFFLGGSASSTVIGGSGSDTIYSGLGGGYFTGGAGGDNYLSAGLGAATLIGGGTGDTLIGGSGKDVLSAGSGNETLVAGYVSDTLTGSSGGKDVFSFVNETANQNYTINMFYVTGSPTDDTLLFKNAADEAAALASYTVSGGSSVMTLADGTKITLEGYTGGISGHTGHL